MSGMQGEAWRTEAWRTAPIDPPIRVLVDALAHVPGVSTHASCGGHLLRDAHGALDIGSAPYVAFAASVDFARRMALAVYRDQTGINALRYCWRLTGWFTPDGEFFYNLWAARPSLAAWRRRCFDSDIARLASVVAELMPISSDYGAGLS